MPRQPQKVACGAKGKKPDLPSRRPELKLIITSATLDPEKLERRFFPLSADGNAQMALALILLVERRTYPAKT